MDDFTGSYIFIIGFGTQFIKRFIKTFINYQQKSLYKYDPRQLTRNIQESKIKLKSKELEISHKSSCRFWGKIKIYSFCHRDGLFVQNATSKVEHEASTSKIGEEQIFYFLQRGISVEKGVELMISGFCKDVFTELPLEFAAEADRLLSLKLEGSVG